MSPSSPYPEEWEAYIASRNRSEARVLKISGSILMACAFWCALQKDPLATVLVPWAGVCFLLATGIAYEAYICLRAYREKDDMKKHELQILSIWLMVSAILVLGSVKCDIEAPVMLVNTITFVVGYEMWQAGAERTKVKK